MFYLKEKKRLFYELLTYFLKEKNVWRLGYRVFTHILKPFGLAFCKGAMTVGIVQKSSSNCYVFVDVSECEKLSYCRMCVCVCVVFVTMTTFFFSSPSARTITQRSMLHFCGKKESSSSSCTRGKNPLLLHLEVNGPYYKMPETCKHSRCVPFFVGRLVFARKLRILIMTYGVKYGAKFIVSA